MIKLFSLIKPKSAEQGRIPSQKPGKKEKPGNARLILSVIIRKGRKKRKGIKRNKLE